MAAAAPVPLQLTVSRARFRNIMASVIGLRKVHRVVTSVGCNPLSFRGTACSLILILECTPVECRHVTR